MRSKYATDRFLHGTATYTYDLLYSSVHPMRKCCNAVQHTFHTNEIKVKCFFLIAGNVVPNVNYISLKTEPSRGSYTADYSSPEKQPLLSFSTDSLNVVFLGLYLHTAAPNTDPDFAIEATPQENYLPVTRDGSITVERLQRLATSQTLRHQLSELCLTSSLPTYFHIRTYHHVER